MPGPGPADRTPSGSVARAPEGGPPANPIQPPIAFAPLCAVFRRFLKSQDLKYTKERADVLDAIIARDGPFEAEELLLDLRGRGLDVSKATVYRTIRLLLDAGIITQSLFDAKQSHYELLYGQAPRDVLVCMKSGRRIEFQSRELAELRDRICRELGWAPVGHRFQIFGIAPQGGLGGTGDEARDPNSPPG